MKKFQILNRNIPENFTRTLMCEKCREAGRPSYKDSFAFFKEDRYELYLPGTYSMQEKTLGCGEVPHIIEIDSVVHGKVSYSIYCSMNGCGISIEDLCSFSNGDILTELTAIRIELQAIKEALSIIQSSRPLNTSNKQLLDEELYNIQYVTASMNNILYTKFIHQRRHSKTTSAKNFLALYDYKEKPIKLKEPFYL